MTDGDKCSNEKCRLREKGGRSVEMNEWLPEQLGTVRNLCDISHILLENGRDDLQPTVLELMLVEIQQMVDENCVKE